MNPIRGRATDTGGRQQQPSVGEAAEDEESGGKWIAFNWFWIISRSAVYLNYNRHKHHQAVSTGASGSPLDCHQEEGEGRARAGHPLGVQIFSGDNSCGVEFHGPGSPSLVQDVVCGGGHFEERNCCTFRFEFRFNVAAQLPPGSLGLSFAPSCSPVSPGILTFPGPINPFNAYRWCD